jgi:hypothetical protein
MAQSDLNCANLALRLLGSRFVLTGSAGILDASVDTSAEGLACIANIADCKRALLRGAEFNFSITRKNVSAQFVSITTITDSGGLFLVTKATHGYSTGDRVTIKDATSFSTANGTWTITVVSVNTFTLDDSVYATTSGITYGSYTTAAAFTYAYSIALPTDCLRILEINENETPEAHKIESGRILTDDEDLRIRYVKDVTDYTLMDALFYQVLAHYLAYNICDHITASDGKKNELHGYLYGTDGKRGILGSAKFSDATEDGSISVQANDWIGARFGSEDDLTRI